MNSHRDNVKDALRGCLEVQGMDISESQLDELKYLLADAVFDALGITEDEQDKCGGYFMLHAEKGERQFIAPLPRDEDGCVIQDDDSEYDAAIDKQTGEEGLPDNRAKELADGAKYTAAEFKAYAKANPPSGEKNDWYIYLQTPICKYGQGYSSTISLELIKTKFVNFYYPMYLEDYERSQAVDKMDKE